MLQGLKFSVRDYRLGFRSKSPRV